MKPYLRHSVAMLCVLMLAGAGLHTTAFAQDDTPEISIVDITEEPTQPPDTNSSTPQIPDSDFLPNDVQRQEEDGYKILRKTFVVDADVTPSELIEQNIMWHGCAYQYLDILKEEMPGTTETKTVRKTVQVTSKTKERASILAAQEPTLSYSEDGYEGKLELDEANLVIEDGDKQSYSYTVTDTKEYTGLASNDPYLVPKTVQKNGVSLSLSNLQWTPVGVQQDGSGLPASYAATAQYSGKAWGSKITGYSVTLLYSGEVKKTVPGKIKYTLIYEEVKPEPDMSAQTDAVQEPGKFPAFWLVVGGCLCVLAAVVIGWIIHRRRR